MPRKTKAQIKQEIIDDAAYNKALRAREQAKKDAEQAELYRLKKELLQNSTVLIDDVEKVLIEIGSKTKASLYVLVNTLPQKLMGKNASDMVDILRENIDEMLADLANDLADSKLIKSDISIVEDMVKVEGDEEDE